ncbi:MAG: hypothetical protein HDR02_03540 [Lachnospiraceae bacterium]|nr:hypothetical protein [Lachnospiraceae bacterium]
MDIKKYLREQIKKCRNRMNLAKSIDCGILFAAAGGVVGMLCELFSLVRPFYYAHLTAGLCFAAGLLAGIGYAVYRRADMSQAARRLDSFGLKERMITAYELMYAEAEEGEDLAELQRQDAMLHYNRLRDRIKIPLWPDRRHVLALVLSAALVVILGILPSPVRERAVLHHQVQEQAKEEIKELEELVDALEGVDMESLTEEQRAQLQELMEAMQRSEEELARADSWESLGAAVERLDYKYGQAQQSLEQLAAQLENPEAAGVVSAQELAKAANPNGTQSVSPQAAVSPGQNGSGDGDGSGNNGENGNGNENGSGGQGGGNGNDNENGSGGQGSGNGEGEGSGGNGNGNGSGNGEGEGSGGNGNGNGSGNGGGNGRGTGSSNAAHDYVSIPNAVADDPSLTGNKYGDQNSDYFRQQNGLAWEGEHVDYSSVLGQYTDSAYEGIATGRYPTGMESVIRDYFENLNK